MQEKIRRAISDSNLDGLRTLLGEAQNLSYTARVSLMDGTVFPRAVRAEEHSEEILNSLIEFMRYLPLKDKFTNIGNAVIVACGCRKIETLEMLLNKLSQEITTTEAQDAFIQLERVHGFMANALCDTFENFNNKSKPCFRMLLNHIKGLPHDSKIILFKDNSISNILNSEYQRLTRLPESNIREDIISEFKENILAILNLAIDNRITKIGRDSLWHYYIKHNLATKDTYELWKCTKDSYENMDEVNNKLLANENLGHEFFADVGSFMVLNHKEINRNTLPDNKKDIFDDIYNLYYDQKDGYKYKIFEDMASLNDVEPVDKVKTAIGILTMDPEEKLALLRTDFSKSSGIKLHPAIAIIITSQSLQTDEILAKILPKFGDRIKEVLLNPAQRSGVEEQKKNSLTQNSIGYPQEDHGEAAVLEEIRVDNIEELVKNENHNSDLGLLGVEE